MKSVQFSLASSTIIHDYFPPRKQISVLNDCYFSKPLNNSFVTNLENDIKEYTTLKGNDVVFSFYNKMDGIKELNYLYKLAHFNSGTPLNEIFSRIHILVNNDLKSDLNFKANFQKNYAENEVIDLLLTLFLRNILSHDPNITSIFSDKNDFDQFSDSIFNSFVITYNNCVPIINFSKIKL